MTLACATFLALALTTSSSAQQTVEKTAVPEAAALKDAEKLIKDLFKDDYAKRAVADRMLLAKKLLEQSESTKDDPASRYVLLRESNSVAGAAGDVATAMKAADLMGQTFKIDALAFKTDTLQTLAKNAKSQDDLAQIATAYLKLSKEATDVDDFSAADKAAAAAGAQAKKGQNLLLINRAMARVKEIAELKGKHDKVRKMKDALAANPEDPAANLEVGQYECFTKGNWAVGLPLLAKGSDAAIKDLAARDLAGTSGPADQAQIGDGWWDLAEKRPPAGREHLRRRSASWYEKAVGKLTGLSLTKTEKRLFDLRSEMLNRGSWVDVSDPKLYGKTGTALDLPNQADAVLAKAPPGEFDGFSARLRLAPDKMSSFCIEYERQVKAIFLNLGVKRIMTSKVEGENWVTEVAVDCLPKDEYVVTILIIEGQYVGYVDGREFFRIPTRREYMTPFKFAVYRGSCIVDQIRLRKRE